MPYSIKTFQKLETFGHRHHLQHTSIHFSTQAGAGAQLTRLPSMGELGLLACWRGREQELDFIHQEHWHCCTAFLLSPASPSYLIFMLINLSNHHQNLFALQAPYIYNVFKTGETFFSIKAALCREAGGRGACSLLQCSF